MVDLSPEVADQLEEHYDPETVERYQEMPPEQAVEAADTAYQETEDALDDLAPDRLEAVYEDNGLAGALAELDDAVDTYRSQAAEHLLGIAIRDELDDIELE